MTKITLRPFASRAGLQTRLSELGSMANG